MVDLCAVRDRLPHGARALRTILALAGDTEATVDEIAEAVADHTGWQLADVQELASRLWIWDGAKQISLSEPGTWAHERALARLLECFHFIKGLRSSAERCADWAKPKLSADDALSIEQAVKARYEAAEWLDDRQAAARRAARAAARRARRLPRGASGPRPRARWRDADDLYAALPDRRRDGPVHG